LCKCELPRHRHRLDLPTSRLVSEQVVVGRPVRRVPLYVRLFSFTELRDRLAAAGSRLLTAAARAASRSRRPAAGCRWSPLLTAVRGGRRSRAAGAMDGQELEAPVLSVVMAGGMSHPRRSVA
jgi:hypothetical protein